jgi:hypothetical protein
MLPDFLTRNNLTDEEKIVYGRLIVYIGFLLFAVAIFYAARNPIQQFINANVRTWNQVMKARP